MHDQVYGDERARRLVELLRGLGARIQALGTDQELLSAGPELMKIMGDARSELFHYEVRATYDTPQTVESKRIVEAARQGSEALDFGKGYDPSNEDGGGWAE